MVLFFAVLLTACNEEKELQGAWKAKSENLMGTIHTLVFDKDRLIKDGTSISIKVTKKSDVFFISRNGNERPFLEIIKKDADTITVEAFGFGSGEYKRTTVQDIEAIRNQPPAPIAKDPF